MCGLITPWNYPLLQASWKVAPGARRRQHVRHQAQRADPEHHDPADAATSQEAGLPDGVGNLVLGAGPEAGAPLSEHPDVDLVSFTGGLLTGRRVMAAAAATVKKVALELGGKNPNVVFADADLDAALDNALTAVFLHSGQVCSAGARLDRRGVGARRLRRRAGRPRAGHPARRPVRRGRGDRHPDLGSAPRQGPGLRRRRRRRRGRPALRRLARPDDPALADGFYFLPTVLDGVHARRWAASRTSRSARC